MGLKLAVLRVKVPVVLSNRQPRVYFDNHARLRFSVRQTGLVPLQSVKHLQQYNRCFTHLLGPTPASHDRKV